MELIAPLLDSSLLVMALVGLTVSFATFRTVSPILERQRIQARLDRINVDRAEMLDKKVKSFEKGTSRKAEPDQNIKKFVEIFKLQNFMLDDKVRQKLAMAGKRGVAPLYTFAAARLVLPLVFFVIAFFYLAVLVAPDSPVMMNLAVSLGAAGIGYFAPSIILKNMITKRQLSIKRAWPDATDLMLICVESGMSVEASIKRVSVEVGAQSLPLAEELSLTTAEMSFLNDRRKAYANLAWRTGLDIVRGVTTGLMQSERYGTSVGDTLRVLTAESRKMRMLEAEKKAAGLPPKLTVPMIVFFLPVLVAVIVGPAMIMISVHF